MALVGGPKHRGEPGSPAFAVVHDHLVQVGGAERVVPVISAALDDAPVHTAFFELALTHPHLRATDVRPSILNRLGWLRRNHRWSFALLAPLFALVRPKAKTTLVSTIGWAHFARPRGATVAYWHAPARWLYDQETYVAEGWKGRIVTMLAPALRSADRRAVSRIDHHLAVSNSVSKRLREIYGIEAEVVHPPVSFNAVPEPVPDLEPGFFLVVSRLLSYKNVDVVIEAMQQLPEQRLVVAGTGPDLNRLMDLAGPNVTFTKRVSDAELAWLYQQSAGLVTVAYEDFGLTPLEAAGMGKPTVALAAGGFLDTVIEGETGLFVPSLDPLDLANAMEKLRLRTWDHQVLVDQAALFSEASFVDNLLSNPALHPSRPDQTENEPEG
ncbi:MAG: glycosyltransferase family 4 protein [Actinomycetia bacterium]|nr:glycosyltransferase family 4 protein [Actinomycetes bacterium]